MTATGAPLGTCWSLFSPRLDATEEESDMQAASASVTLKQRLSGISFIDLLHCYVDSPLPAAATAKHRNPPTYTRKMTFKNKKLIFNKIKFQ
ncbi:hypothetical protein [Chromobacterium sphagni]|uniref:hypothetical protein n=1 Tax=Chromobacterium sphagni TaxID=1903179 RepID=UPI001EFB7196|nr:hypothetical protein [Chromobacterium sphagni]